MKFKVRALEAETHWDNLNQKTVPQMKITLDGIDSRHSLFLYLDEPTTLDWSIGMEVTITIQ